MPEQEHFQPVEMRRAPMTHELLPRILHHAVEHRKRPAPLEDPVRRLIVPGLALIPLLAGREFERHHRPATTFLRTLAIPLVGDKELQGSQQK